MVERALSFIKQHGNVISDHTKYIRDTDWRNFHSRKDRQNEYKLHVEVLNGFLDKLKFVVQETGDELNKDQRITKFNNNLVKQIENHCDRATNYFNSERWQDYNSNSFPEDEVAEEKAAEIKFQNLILKEIIKFKEDISKLNLNKQISIVNLPIFADKKISIPMRHVAEQRFPEIVEFLKQKK